MASSSDGCLYDTRKPEWAKAPLRANYRVHHRQMVSLADVKATLRAGSLAWPGGYTLYLITRDGAALCFKCAQAEFRQIAWDYLNDCSTGWRVEACDVNYEDSELTCEHCNKRIEPAYS
jgi:hypothetical protein